MTIKPFLLRDPFQLSIWAMLGLSWLFLTASLGWASPSDMPSGEKKKIESLISGVERMTDAVFIRNGRQYKAAVAAEFLRRKWRSRRSEIHSASEFIDKVASYSSTSGKPYTIRWRDGRERNSAEYFRAQLSFLEDRPNRQPG